MPEPCRVVIFARTPEPGRVKTRLIPALGKRGACLLHQRMVIQIAEQARAAFPGGRIELWVTPDPDHLFLLALARRLNLELHRQAPRSGHPDDLGERMATALNAGPWPAMVVGSDAPQLDAGRLRQLEEYLQYPDCEAAIVPATDGGYVALAARQPVALFERIAWGTGEVLEQTLARAHRQGIRVRLTPALPDIDRPGDLSHCPPALLKGLAIHEP